MNNKWMTDIKRKADSYERKAPDDMLDNIKQEMARRGLTMAPPHTIAQSRRLTWHRWAVAASLAAIVGCTAVYLAWRKPENDRMLSRQQQPQNPAMQQKRQASTNVDLPATQSYTSASVLTAAASVQGRSATAPQVLAPSYTPTSKDKENNSFYLQSPSVIHNTEEGETANRAAASVEHETTEQHPSAASSRHPYTTDGNEHLLALNSENRHRAMHVSAYYQGVGGFQKNGNSSGPVMTMSDPMLASMPVLYTYPTLLNKILQETPIHSEKHHHLPVRAGLSVSIPLNERWGVTTGLTYSTMSSDFEDLYATHSESSTQRLHYLGIPVSLHYNVWQQSKVKVYASAGGEVEKLVYGKKKTRYADAVTTKVTTSEVSEHRPVLSTHVNAGISYTVIPGLSVFAEPGLTYYFKNGSGVKSAYTDKQLLFNVNVGVRFGK